MKQDYTMPYLEIAKKIADASGISLYYLVGEGVNASRDKKDSQQLKKKITTLFLNWVILTFLTL